MMEGGKLKEEKFSVFIVATVGVTDASLYW